MFLCVHNAGRSQMAAGFTRHLGASQIEVSSAGSEPAEKINAVAVQAMNEIGIDISSELPRGWGDGSIQQADVVVTMGCGDECPLFPGKTYLDWELEDPAGKSIETVREIRDEIESKVREMLTDLGIELAESAS